VQVGWICCAWAVICRRGLVENHLDVPIAWTDLHLVSAPPLWDMVPATGRVKRVLLRAALRLKESLTSTSMQYFQHIGPQS